MKVVAQNKKARFDFEIIDTLEAGIVLSGQEVKSCRAGHIHLSGSYVSFRGGTPVLKNASIAPYRFATMSGEYDEKQDRELLIKKSELARLTAIEQEKGMAIIPLEVRAGRFIKLLIGIGRGRKKLDKRQRIRDREVERRVRRGDD
jgi:SsrA-binding protein